ncbi:MAG: YraN family protein [Bacteroidaceae bacterium]|nr:YraN family protein [Bacteroidaceae bacterium]MBQ4055842.1 YraN family protein [Bacteroidaceae bacterium]
MATHNVLGKEGEEEAVQCLLQKGYTILHRNWRAGKKELDIVAMDNQQKTLVVVEVKTRKNRLFGEPEEAINDTKIRRIVSSTDTYLRKFAIDLPVRFDIIAIVGEKPPFQIEHLEDAFYSPIW